MPPEAVPVVRSVGVCRSETVPSVTAEVSSRRAQSLAVALALLAVVAHHLVVMDGVATLGSHLLIGLQIGLIVTGATLVRRYASNARLQQLTSPALLAGAAAVLAWEALLRWTEVSGQPFELLTMGVIRNMVAGLAIASVWTRPQRLGVLLSLFLVQFDVTTSRAPAITVLAVIFLSGAAGWMCLSYWDSLTGLLRGQRRAHGPRWILLIPAGVLLFLGIGSAASDNRVATALWGIVPSSGGSGAGDPYARQGVGDGEMLVAGTTQIQSFAPIEDAPFLQDDQPSLYDLFDDSYEPEMGPQRMDRAISLPPELSRRIREHLHRKTEKAHRQFSTLRQARDQKPLAPAPDILSNALFYVAGRVPLHLRLEVYDLFDGVTWYPETIREETPGLTLVESGGKPWVRLTDRGGARGYLGAAETHALKIVRFHSNVIPAPQYLHGVHIDRVDRVDMFRHGPEGLVALDRDQLPSLVPIHLASRPVDWDRVAAETRSLLQTPHRVETSDVPAPLDPARLRALALQWSPESQPGWSQVIAVIDRLRRDYTLDPDWRAKDSDIPPVQQFLFESRRGPDYQFATAAALLLRSLGYSTRVVSGFYATPRKYDSRSRHTPVEPSDVHFWTEVRVAGGDWLTIDASPGYEVLGPVPGLLERCRAALRSACVWVVQHPGSCLALVVLGVVAWLARYRLRDMYLVACCRLATLRCPSDTVVATVRLLRKRAKLAGLSIAPSQTYHAWLGQFLQHAESPELAAALTDLRRLIDEAAYSARGHRHSAAIRLCCMRCQQGCSLDWLRNIASRSDRHSVNPVMSSCTNSPRRHKTLASGKSDCHAAG